MAAAQRGSAAPEEPPHRGRASNFFPGAAEHGDTSQSAQAMASTSTRLVLVKDATPVWLNFGATAFLRDIAAGHFSGPQMQDIFDWATTENRNLTWLSDDQKHAFRVDGDGRLLYRLPGDRHGPVWVEVKPVSLSMQADNAAYYDAARMVTVARTRSS
jgi:hypothetical protein